MIINDKIKIKLNNNNIKHYELKGYSDLVPNNTIDVNTIDVPFFSRIIVECKCDICNTTKEIKLNDYNKVTDHQKEKYYCQKCKFIKTKETNNLLYGADNVFQSDIIKLKIKKTNNLLYGVDYPNQNKEIFEKTKKTNKKRYRFEFVQQNEDIRKKTEDTNFIRYGNKTSLLNDDVKIKIKRTNNLLYGADNPLENFDIQQKSKNTRNSNIIKKYNNLNILNISNDVYTISCDNNKNHTFDISSGLLYHRYHRYKTIVCTKCNEINSKNISGLQTQLHNFIKENYNETILINDRKIISPHEIDIYLPDIKVGFEFNGVYWHSEQLKGKKYHYTKTKNAIDNNITLFHIYEDDWMYKREIIESMILNKLKNTPNRIFARKTDIKEISDNNMVREFLQKNHLQGFVGSKIKLGLFIGDDLVSLMTFGKLRKPMGTKNINDNYEMLRFCNKLNTNVIGGASKLFKYFIRKYKPSEVISYANRSHSNGNLYKQIGFEFLSETVPNYYYVIDGIRHYRFNFRKDILVKQGFDSNKSEHEIMLERGYYRIFDSGNLKFSYKNKLF